MLEALSVLGKPGGDSCDEADPPHSPSPTRTALPYFPPSSEFVYATLPDRVNLEDKADAFWL